MRKSSKKNKRKKKKKKGLDTGKDTSSEDDNKRYDPDITVEVNRGKGEMPEGALDSGGDSTDGHDDNDPHKALDINLDE